MSIRYENCSLTIKNLQNTVRRKPDSNGAITKPGTVEYRAPYLIKGSLGWSPLIELTVKRLSYWVNYSIEEEARTKEPRKLSKDLQVLGSHLYNILFNAKNIRDAFNKTYEEFLAKKRNDPNLRLRLKLIFDKEAEQISTLPWEFLYLPKIPGRNEGAFLVSKDIDLILTRFIQPSPAFESSDAFKSLGAKKENLKILIVTSQPDELGSIDISEVNKIKTALSKESNKKRIEISVENDLTKDNLEKKIGEIRPHIFHFIGHGQDGKIALISMDSKDALAYNIGKRGKQAHLINNEELTSLFSSDNKPRLIVLQACQGATSNSIEIFNNAARALMNADIPAVVAMQYSITNEDANLFTQTIYEQLSQGKDVDEAVKEGRIQLGRRSPSWGHPRFGTPVVYLQSEKAIIEFSSEEPEDDQKQIRCPYYAECGRKIYPDAKRCACNRDIVLQQESKPVELGSGSPNTSKRPQLTSEAPRQSEVPERGEVKQEDKQSPIDTRTNRSPRL